MLDGGASLAFGIGGTARDGSVKCLHAHAAFALAEPGYLLGERVLAEAAPLFPKDRCCSLCSAVDLAMMEWEQGLRPARHSQRDRRSARWSTGRRRRDRGRG